MTHITHIHIPQGVLARLVTIIQSVMVETGERLVQMGDIGSAMIIIEKGVPCVSARVWVSACLHVCACACVRAIEECTNYERSHECCSSLCECCSSLCAQHLQNYPALLPVDVHEVDVSKATQMLLTPAGDRSWWRSLAVRLLARSPEGGFSSGIIR